MTLHGTVAEWLVAGGTIVLAAVAIFQKTIHSWIYYPKLRASIKTEPPDCHGVPFTNNGVFVASSIYLRLWVENYGNTWAKNAEVYAKELLTLRADGTWERVAEFPPMNLVWSHLRGIYFPGIGPKMGKHCDLGHITDPASRHLLSEDSPRLGLTVQQTSLAFDLMVAPNHRGHIIGPGKYKLRIILAAENARPREKTIAISLQGTWYPDETRMLRDGVGVSIT